MNFPNFPFSDINPEALVIASYLSAIWLKNFNRTQLKSYSLIYFPNNPDALQWAIKFLEQGGWTVDVSDPDADGFLTITLSASDS